MGAEFPKRFGKYVLLDLLNKGGMAEVFLGKVSGVERFERLIAIKCMRPELAADDQFAAMFIDEANLAGQLTHANVAQIYELGRHKGQLYIAMELIEGRDLRAIIDRSQELGRPLPVQFAAYVASRAAAGLDYAHRKEGTDGKPLNLVHRDISPSNLLVSYEGEVKVVDFGIAKASARAADTRVGVVKGKISYMSPEQLGPTEIDRRADIFTLGAVLYESLAGRRLFSAETEFEILQKVKFATVPSFDTDLPDTPAEVRDVLKKMLARKPKDRYQYASEVAKALEPILIQDRSIFGPVEAAKLLGELFSADAIRKARHTLREHQLASVKLLAQDESNDEEWLGRTETFSSAFGEKFEADDLVEDDEEQETEDLWKEPTAETPSARLQLGLDDDEDDDEGYDDEYDEEEEEEEEEEGPRTFASGDRWGSLWRWGIAAVLAGLLALGYFVVIAPAGAPKSKPGRRPETVRAANDVGFVTVRVKGIKSAQVFIDGESVGRTPVVEFGLDVGSHMIKVEGRRKKTRSRKVAVTRKHTRKSPKSVMFGF